MVNVNDNVVWNRDANDHQRGSNIRFVSILFLSSNNDFHRYMRRGCLTAQDIAVARLMKLLFGITSPFTVRLYSIESSMTNGPYSRGSNHLNLSAFLLKDYVINRG